jgi:leucyl aminopeptidase
MNHLFLSLLALFYLVYGAERLIQFNETYTLWINEDDIEKMSWDPNLHFMDITDYPEIKAKSPKVFAIPIDPVHQDEVNKFIATINSNTQFNHILRLSTDFTTRYYTSQSGVDAVNYWIAQYRSYIRGRTDVEVAAYPHTWAQPSVVARITGTTKPDEIIVLGGHIDSTASGGSAPGADDDASGSATVLEIFRVLSEGNFKPERTIEFHAYAAEEAGLRGSQAIATAYANAGVNVVAMLQFDMTGYVGSGTTPTIGVITDFTTPALTAFIRKLVTTYTNLGFTNTACGYACSDHASWNRQGYTDGFVFEATFANSNPYIHTPNDLRSRLSQTHCAEFAKLGVGFAIELAYAEDSNNKVIIE